MKYRSQIYQAAKKATGSLFFFSTKFFSHSFDLLRSVFHKVESTGQESVGTDMRIRTEYAAKMAE